MSKFEFECEVCQFRLFRPLGRLSVSTLGLYDDGRFPGRLILALNEHHEDFSRLDPELTIRFIQDVQKAGRALEAGLAPMRVNYAILGNVIAHVHCHLIPRYGDDPVPDQSPWKHPEAAYPLRPSDLEKVKRRLVTALSTTQ